MPARSYGTKGTEPGVLLTPHAASAPSSLPLVIFAHGRGATGRAAYGSEHWGYMQSVVEAGYAVLSTDLSSTTHWGNDAAQTKISDAKTYGQTTFGAKAGKVALVASSMGALAALNWTRANTASVACLALVVPITDLAYQHDTNPNGWAAEIETAHGGAAAYSAAVATHDPNQNIATHAAGPKIKVWYASNDAVAPTARQSAFITGTGAASVSLGAVGHTATTVDPTQVVTFLQANLT